MCSCLRSPECTIISIHNVAKLKYFRMVVMDQNYIHKEVGSKLSFGNAYFFLSPVKNPKD